ncbi:hypothetical protein K525DRAFT_265883 [Schizophyllum commune Loenen D]|nr:hypothetical protein K525DRAFT_265883 [Schizophyllum commune Loenen D]
MVHSHNDREGSGSPSRKRSRSPAGEHSPDAPAAKRRSPTPEDSADTGPDRRRSDFTRLGSLQRPSRRSQGRTSPSAYLMPRTSSSPGNARSPACPPDGQGDYTPPFNFDLSGVPRRVRNVGPSSPSLRTPTATQDPSINPAPASNSEDSMFDASVALNDAGRYRFSAPASVSPIDT